MNYRRRLAISRRSAVLLGLLSLAGCAHTSDRKMADRFQEQRPALSGLLKTLRANPAIQSMSDEALTQLVAPKKDPDTAAVSPVVAAFAAQCRDAGIIAIHRADRAFLFATEKKWVGTEKGYAYSDDSPEPAASDLDSYEPVRPNGSISKPQFAYHQVEGNWYLYKMFLK